MCSCSVTRSRSRSGEVRTGQDHRTGRGPGQDHTRPDAGANSAKGDRGATDGQSAVRTAGHAAGGTGIEADQAQNSRNPRRRRLSAASPPICCARRLDVRHRPNARLPRREPLRIGVAESALYPHISITGNPRLAAPTVPSSSSRRWPSRATSVPRSSGTCSTTAATSTTSSSRKPSSRRSSRLIRTKSCRPRRKWRTAWSRI